MQRLSNDRCVHTAVEEAAALQFQDCFLDKTSLLSIFGTRLLVFPLGPGARHRSRDEDQ